MKLQLKRSLKTLTDNITAQAPTVDQMEYGELAINYATTDATIFLKDSNNVIQKLQVSAVPDVPAGETLDDRYVSLSGSTLTGNLTAPSFIGGVARTSIGAPTTGQNGELWWNTFNGRLYIYDGDNSSWVDASPDSFTLGAGYYDKNESDAQYVAKAGSTMTGPLLLSGNPGGEALAATPKQYVDGQVTGLDTTLRTYIDAQIATRAATTYVNTQLSLKADTTYVTSAITTSETAAATAYVSKSGDVISGDLTANAFIGDGSQLTGVGSETIISNTPPTPANYEVGTMWWNSDSTDTSLYILYQDPIGPNGDPGGKYWIEASPAPDSIGFSGTHTGDSTFTGNMSVTGNGTFTGSIASSGSLVNYTTLSNGAANSQNSWTLAPSSTTTQKHLQIIPSQDGSDIPGVLFYKSGIGNVEGNTDVFIGGDLTGDAFSPKISLKGDGSASFANYITSGVGDPGIPNIGYININGPSGQIYISKSTSAAVQIFDSNNNRNAILLNGDGSATFTGIVKSDDSIEVYNRSVTTGKGGAVIGLAGKDTASERGFMTLYANTLAEPAFRIMTAANDTDSKTVKVGFYNDGSATFASYVESDLFSVSRSSVENKDNYSSKLSIADTGKHFNAKDTGGGTVASINADGSATFASGTSNSAGVEISKNNSNASFAPLYLKQSNTSGNLITGRDDFNGVNTFTVSATGSATFAGHITTNGLNIYTLAPLTNGGQLGYDDSTKSLRLYSNSSLGTNAKTQFHFNQSGTADITFTEGGSAEFDHYVISKRYAQQSGLSVNYNGTDYGVVVYDQTQLYAGIGLDGSATFAGNLNVSGFVRGGANSTLYIADDIALTSAKSLMLGGANTKISNDGIACTVDILGTEGLRINDGKVSIYSGAIDLNYNGSASFAGNVSSSAHNTNEFTIDGQGDVGITNLVYKYQNSNKFTVNNSGTAFFAGPINGTTVGTSDIKFKENIEEAPSQLADIEAFELKTYDWKDSAPLSDELKSKQKLGLIAQEVEEICPEMICEVADQDGDSYKAINHDVLIMKLLGAVKELAAEVAALKAS